MNVITRRPKGSGSFYLVNDNFLGSFPIKGAKPKKRSLKTSCRKMAERIFEAARKAGEEVILDSEKFNELCFQIQNESPDSIANNESAHIAEPEVHTQDEISDKSCVEKVFETPLRKLLVAKAFQSFKGLRLNGNIKESTFIEYERDFGYFLKYLDEVGKLYLYMHEITSDHAYDFAKKIGLKFADKTYNRIIRLCSRVFRELAYEAGIHHDPFSVVARIKNEKSQIKRAFTMDEMNLVNKELSSGNYSEETVTAFIVAPNTALRLCDISLLKWENIDLENDIITVMPRKTSRYNKYIQIPINDKLKKRLLKIRGNTACSGYVLPETALTYEKGREKISRRFNQIIRRAGISDKAITFHGYRHTFVSICAQKGVPISFVQDIVGHMTPAMTKHYSTIDMASKRRASNTVNETLNDKPIDKQNQVNLNNKEIMVALKGMLSSLGLDFNSLLKAAS